MESCCSRRWEESWLGLCSQTTLPSGLGGCLTSPGARAACCCWDVWGACCGGVWVLVPGVLGCLLLLGSLGCGPLPAWCQALGSLRSCFPVSDSAPLGDRGGCCLAGAPQSL